VRLEGILDRKLVEPELGLEPPKKLKARFMQSDPDDMPWAARPLARVLHRDLGDSFPAEVCRRGHHAGFPQRC
jgi:hypothetical protein